MQRGLLIVVSGASGTGKGTVCKKLLSNASNIIYSISATTRAPRAGETDGVEYYFLSKENFEQWIDEGAFLEYANVYGNYYGTPLNKVEEQLNMGNDVLLEIDTQGALKVQEKCPDSIFIFLLPPSIEILRQRIEGRASETPETLKRRLSAAEAEIDIGKRYNYVVVNDEVDIAVDKIKSIIIAEHCHVDKNMDLFNKIKMEE